jgi:hypothetical protein
MKELSKFRRHIEQRWAEQVRSLGRIHRQIVVAAKQALHRIANHDRFNHDRFNQDRLLIPVPARVVNRRRFDRSRSRD